MNYKLFIDDDPEFRLTPVEDGVIWMRAYSSSAALEIVRKYGYPIHISFDHDLGGEDVSTDFIREVLCDLNENQDYPKIPFTYDIHSANPLAKERIDSLFKSYCKVRKMKV